MVNSALSSKRLTCEQIDDLEKISKEICDFGMTVPIWLINGVMGAGKTTTIKAICKHLKVEDNVTSPTYSLVNEYRASSGETIYHFDFYRIDDEEEAIDIGTEEYLMSGNLCFLEWSSKILNLLPRDNYMTVSIEVLDNASRVIDLVRYD